MEKVPLALIHKVVKTDLKIKAGSKKLQVSRTERPIRVNKGLGNQ